MSKRAGGSPAEPTGNGGFARAPSVDTLEPAARELAERTLEWCDALWDEERGLPWMPEAAGYAGPGVPDGRLHLVPQAAWYAFGLLLRRGEGGGDAARAERILRELVALQYDRPDTPWHGSFARFAESPEPGESAVEWQDYDPNWRQFLGTAFTAILALFGAGLPADLVDALEDAIALAVRGEPPERVPPSYSNIALLRAFLEVEAGARWGELPWTERGEALAAAVVERFDRHGVFEEYNSPTYYGLDLFALALWRGLSSSPLLRREGARLEAALWRDVVRWYHPGLRNLCGPFTRTYGMDMTVYVSLLGLWVAGAIGIERAPLPRFEPGAEHGHDFFLGPLVAALGPRLPDGVGDALERFEGPRRIRQPIADEPARVATGWLGEHAMSGADAFEVDLSGWDQYVAATLHWRHSDGSVAWLAVRAPGPSRAEAVEGGLEIDWAPVDPDALAVVRVRAPGADPADLGDDRWRLPGLDLEVTTDAVRSSTTATSSGLRVELKRPKKAKSCGLALVASPSGD